MIILIKENNGKIATFLTEWDLLFYILQIYIFTLYFWSSAISVFFTGEV